ncbi:MAG: transketolase [Bdellovibrionota bacterium]
MSDEKLKTIAKELRILIIEMLSEASSGHPGGSLSTVDIMTVLWFHEMRRPNGDRFILSKGHAAPALYAALAKCGLINIEEIKTLRKLNSRLQGHPDRVRLPIVEASTGSLGQGLSVAQGIAMGTKMSGEKSRIYCVIGDGESQEGQIWETAMSAPKFKLSNLCVILDYNKGQIDGHVADVMPIEPVIEKWRAFGWHTIEIDGHDIRQIREAFGEARELQEKCSIKPVFILANTVKGKGVPFMENKIEWHGVAPTPEQAREAIAAIKGT